MRKCVRCGSDMTEGLYLGVSVSVSTYDGDDVGVGDGGGSIDSIERTYDTGKKTLFGKPKYVIELFGEPKAALCPNCGEISLYVEGEDTGN